MTQTCELLLELAFLGLKRRSDVSAPSAAKLFVAVAALVEKELRAPGTPAYAIEKRTRDESEKDEGGFLVADVLLKLALALVPLLLFRCCPVSALCREIRRKRRFVLLSIAYARQSIVGDVRSPRYGCTNWSIYGLCK
jgi:hypothetical protein